MDPTHFPQPEAFQPQRFLDTQVPTIGTSFNVHPTPFDQPEAF